jgi:hypothetical protein
MKGTKFSRILFQLVPKMLPIEETDAGLLPTPMAQARDIPTQEQLQKRKEMYGGERRAMYLNHFAAMGMLPTPQSRDWKGAQGQSYKGEAHDLPGVMMKGMLPTPASRDYKGARSKEALQESGRKENNSLPDSFSQAGKSSQLNPLFVEEMMGFPKGWTESPFLSGETNQSKHTETQ